MRTAATLILAGLLFTARPAATQERKDPGPRSVYKVEFTIRDGSQTDPGRHYAILVAADGRSVFRLGNKVPYVTGRTEAGSGATPVSTQYNYADIGVTIDCHLREIANKVAMSTNIELSSVLHSDKGSSGIEPHPTIAQTRIEVTADLEPGKPTVLSTVDDPVTQRKLNIEAIATKVL